MRVLGRKHTKSVRGTICSWKQVEQGRKRRDPEAQVSS